MNREIKFRAWDGEKMWYPETPSFDGCDTFFALYNDKQKTIGWGLYDRKLENRIVSGAYEENILMQFTGLKDKNGKEIYEGDVVNAAFMHHGEPGEQFRAFIFYNEYIGAFRIGYNSLGGGSQDEIYFRCQVEVIGNIYENHELLKQPT